MNKNYNNKFHNEYRKFKLLNLLIYRTKVFKKMLLKKLISHLTAFQITNINTNSMMMPKVQRSINDICLKIKNINNQILPDWNS